VRYELDLAVDFEENRVAGSARVTVRNPSGAPVPKLSFRLYRLLTVEQVRASSGAPLEFSQRVVAFEDDPKRQANVLSVPLPTPLAPGGSETIEIVYGGYLAGYVETGALYIQDRVDEAFTILREDADAYPTLRPPSHAKSRADGLPEFAYLARITVPESHVVANGGELVQRTVRKGRATYVYRNIRPAWRMDFAIARFRTFEASGLRLFALPEDAASAERVLRAAAGSMSLYREWFGPLHGAQTFTIIEIPDGWGSQADVTSILQTAAAFRDPAKIHELYHETSHLWNAPSRDPSFCRWNEGLARFLQALMQETRDGGPSLDEVAEQTARRLRERLGEEPRLRTVPMIDYGREGMTGDSYRTGMLMFSILHRLVGERAFRAIVGGYYQKHAAAGGTTEEFVEEAKAASGVPVEAVFRDWLFTTRWCELLASGTPVRALAETYRRPQSP
jgi:aminopeptidase N